MSTLSIPDARDIDSVLWRAPAGLRQLISNSAEHTGASQNAYLTASLAFSQIVFGVLPRVGIPGSLLILFDQLDEAAKESGTVLSAFHEADWIDVKPTIELLASSGIVEGVKARVDLASQSTTTYTLRFSKAGQQTWTLMSPWLRDLAQSIKQRKEGSGC